MGARARVGGIIGNHLLQLGAVLVTDDVEAVRDGPGRAARARAIERWSAPPGFGTCTFALRMGIASPIQGPTSMEIDARGAPPLATGGRVAFEVHCAPCHGPSGSGVYLGRTIRPPVIAGADVAQIIDHVRNGKGEMPPFSEAVLTDASLHELALYVHGMPATATPGERAGRIGPRELDPFAVGLICWGALIMLTLCLAVFFAEKRC